jgi:hypothetical protein
VICESAVEPASFSAMRDTPCARRTRSRRPG